MYAQFWNIETRGVILYIVHIDADQIKQMCRLICPLVVSHGLSHILKMQLVPLKV